MRTSFTSPQLLIRLASGSDTFSTSSPPNSPRQTVLGKYIWTFGLSRRIFDSWCYRLRQNVWNARQTDGTLTQAALSDAIDRVYIGSDAVSIY